MNSESNYPIDFVIAWVDGSDEEWLKNYSKYKNEGGDQQQYRFRDMELLPYWFRGVEKFAPWVNKVYFVTCGQTPKWLNTDQPKLVLVNHEDYIPKQYLPTFSSHTIELNFHRIENLSEHFVYFNDDMFLTSETRREDFFRNGLPCDSAVINYAAPIVEPLNLVPFVNAAVINRNFNKKQVIKNNIGKFFTLKNGKYLLKNYQFIMGKYFPGFKFFHLESSMLKSTYETVWNKEWKKLDDTCSHRFREYTDVNQWLIQNWQICEGKTYPRSIKFGYYGALETEQRVLETAKAIREQNYKTVCANDTKGVDFDWMKSVLVDAFEHILSEKCSFEK